MMEKTNQSRYFVIAFLIFVGAIYTGSYFYTRSHNDFLLSAPRLVGLVEGERALDERLKLLTPDARVAETWAMIARKEITVVTQAEYQDSMRISDKIAIVDCLELAERLKRTRRKDKLLELSASWGYAACVPEDTD